MKNRIPISEHILLCTKCNFKGEVTFVKAGPHIKANCSKCGAYIKFVKQYTVTGRIEEQPPLQNIPYQKEEDTPPWE